MKKSPQREKGMLRDIEAKKIQKINKYHPDSLPLLGTGSTLEGRILPHELLVGIVIMWGLLLRMCW